MSVSSNVLNVSVDEQSSIDKPLTPADSEGELSYDHLLVYC